MPDSVNRWTDPVAWLIAAAALVTVLWLHLLPALLAGLLVYELVHVVAPMFARRLASRRARLLAVLALATFTVAVLSAMVVGAVAFLRSDAGSVAALLRKMAEIIESSRNFLPEWLLVYLPENADALREELTLWLREHAPRLRLAGAEAGRVFAQILIGMVIGAMLSLGEATDDEVQKPLARALIGRATRLGDAFRRVVFAQVRISAINTAFTAIYLAAVLPLAGVHLPFTKTMIAITFIAGLLPVIGNLISNTVIVVVSLAHSPQAALASLAFLIVIHKLEYFLNARIVGSRISAKAWEVLLAMLVLEAAFGIAGLVAAPIYYAYVKQELAERGLV